MTDGCLEVKLPTVWTDEGAEMGRVREEKGRRKKIREEKESKKENESARKGRKVIKHYTAVVRSTSGSQHVKNIARSEHFGNLRFRKSAHDCGAKHISKRKW